MKNCLIILLVLLVVQIGFGQKEGVEFNGTGYHETHNVYGQILRKGFFENYKLINGLRYKYDEYNRFIKIEIYKNAEFVKDSAVVYPPLSTKVEGNIKLKSQEDSLQITIVTENMNNEPTIILKQGKNNPIIQESLPANGSTTIDFSKLNLSDGVYYIIVQDSISPRISESFVVGNVSFPLK